VNRLKCTRRCAKPSARDKALFAEFHHVIYRESPIPAATTSCIVTLKPLEHPRAGAWTGTKYLLLLSSFFAVKNEQFFSPQSLQPQQVFGLRVGKSADYLLKVCNAFQRRHRKLDKQLRIIASWLNPSFSPKHALTKLNTRLCCFG
jgi:hypothetical protein